MAFDFQADPRYVYGPGGMLGRSVGTGISQGISGLLEGLHQKKAMEAQQQQGIQALQQLGFTPQEAEAVVNLDPRMQEIFVKEKLQAPRRTAYNQAISAAAGQPIVGNLADALTPEEVESGASAPGTQELQQVDLSLLRPEERLKVEQLRLQREAAEEKKEGRKTKEKAEAYKLTKDERKQINDQARAAKDDLEAIDRIIDLEKDNKLSTAGYNELLKRSGLDIGALQTPESQEFEKITANWIKNMKQYFGGKVTNMELEAFLKTIPNLSQSPEGRKRVLSSLRKAARLQVEYANTMRQIIKENKGIPPLDLIEQIDERMDTKREKIADLFKKDLERQVPEAPSAISTTLQAGLGSAIGRVPSSIGKTVTGATTGAGIGAYLGGPAGILPGAVIGGAGSGLASLLGLI